MTYPPDMHFWILIVIIIIMGAFGGFLNYLHNFDINSGDKKNKNDRYKYILLGIGAASLVPAFLKMISSDLIKDSKDFDNNCFLIFGGFCLIAAIFSRRFITTIGEKILEAAKNAELVSNENKKQIESTKLELTSTQERIEDVKVAVNLHNPEIKNINEDAIDPKKALISLVSSYIVKTSMPDYSERLKIKAELGRKMGLLIVRNNLPRFELLKDYPEEGMYLALAYSVDLRPNEEGLDLLNRISKLTTQLYIKYVILVAYRTLASSGIIKSSQVQEIIRNVNSFRADADRALLRNIEDTLYVLNFINPSNEY